MPTVNITVEFPAGSDTAAEQFARDMEDTLMWTPGADAYVIEVN